MVNLYSAVRVNILFEREKAGISEKCDIKSTHLVDRVQ